MDRRSFFTSLTVATIFPDVKTAKALERMNPCCPLCKCLLPEPAGLKDPLETVTFEHGKPSCACDPIPGLSFRVQFYREVTVG